MCNTRKSWSVPSGIVRFSEELFGSESLSQVYGILIKYLSSLSKLELEVLVYDDVCHLVKFALNHIFLQRNKSTEFFNSLKFSFDCFHFKNHIDPFCHENFNPKDVPEIKSVNTQICEQL